MLCPRDQSFLLHQSHLFTDVHICRSCRGLWIGMDKLGLCLDCGTDHGQVSLVAGRNHSWPVCPRCNERRLTPKSIHGISADVCHACKCVWLDAGEMEAILRWHRRRKPLVRAGGVKPKAAGASTIQTVQPVVPDAGTASTGLGVAGDVAEALLSGFADSSESALEGAAALVEFLGSAAFELFS
jgi:Zn-finger nucleic acid-binding protein